jgi:hypothetical protein
MATVYHRDQAGAPTYAFGSTGAIGLLAFKTILKACLVNGYGTKAAAGWVLISEATNHLVLRNGSGSCYVCFNWVTNANYVTLYLSETFSGVINDVMTGDGLKTGVAANNGAPQRFYIGYFAYQSETTTWTVAADSKTFSMCTTFASSNLAITASNVSNYGVMLYVGEDKTGNPIAIGGVNSSSDANPVCYFNGESGFTSLRYPASGLLVSSGSIAVATPGIEHIEVSAVSAVTALEQISLSPALWAANNVFAGYLRGLALCPILSRLWASHAAQSIGMPTPLTVRNANTPISLGDGYSYFATVKNYMSSFVLMTDNPVFW